MTRRLFYLIAVVPLGAGLVQQAPKPAPKPTGFAPIAYYNKSCVYCHSKEGASYDAASLRKYSDKQLLARLLEMTDEKARAPLSDRELEVLAAWFRSLGRQEPFVVWTGLKDSAYTLEATKGATLTSSIGTLKLDKDKWTLTGAKAGENPTLTATKDQKKSVLKLSEGAFTHASK